MSDPSRIIAVARPADGPIVGAARHVGLYERIGFEVVEELWMDDGGPLVPTM